MVAGSGMAHAVRVAPHGAQVCLGQWSFRFGRAHCKASFHETHRPDVPYFCARPLHIRVRSYGDARPALRRERSRSTCVRARSSSGVRRLGRRQCVHVGRFAWTCRASFCIDDGGPTPLNNTQRILKTDPALSGSAPSPASSNTATDADTAEAGGCSIGAPLSLGGSLSGIAILSILGAVLGRRRARAK